MNGATQAIRAWVNGNSGLTSGPLSRGAYFQSQASPADGAYAVLERQPAANTGMTAEDGPWDYARIAASIYAGTIPAAELAASAYADAVQALAGVPVAMGNMTCLASDNLTGPSYQPAGSTGEQFCFQVTADFVMTQ